MEESPEVQRTIYVRDSLTTTIIQFVTTLIALFALCLSILTALRSAQSNQMQELNQQVRELSAATQQILSVRLTRAQWSAPNASIEGALSSMESAATARAYRLAEQLQSSAPAPELNVLGDSLAKLENYEGAKKVSVQAVNNATNFYAEVEARRLAGWVYIVHGEGEDDRNKGDRYYESAMTISQKYADIARDKDEIAYTNAQTQLLRAQAWSGQNCEKSSDYLFKAEAEAKTRPASTYKEEQITVISRWQNVVPARCVNMKLPIPSMPIDAPEPQPGQQSSANKKAPSAQNLTKAK